MSSESTGILIDEVWEKWYSDFEAGKIPPRYQVGRGSLEELHVGPGRIVVIGAPPGRGKTALIMQMVFDALRLNPTLKAVICNVEMRPEVLIEREVARCTTTPYEAIQIRQKSLYHSNFKSRLEVVKSVFGRLSFVTPPFNLVRVMEEVVRLSADIVVLDYIQRIPHTTPMTCPHFLYHAL